MTVKSTLFHSIDVGDGSSFRPWHIVDISKDGARLRVDTECEIPERFTLMVKGASVKFINCKVAWRSDTHVGVKFEQPEDAARDSA